MNIALEITKIGDGLGVILPAEALARLNASEGARVQLTESTDGKLQLEPDAQFAAQMKVFTGLMDRYPNALRELAK
jgi:antitoxin component of MazEF toxin-antitoxin module